MLKYTHTISLLAVLLLGDKVNAFTNLHPPSYTTLNEGVSLTMTQLSMYSNNTTSNETGRTGNFVDDFFQNVGKFFGNPSKKTLNFERSATKDFAGSGAPLIDLEAKSIKVGGLRLLLTLHLMGQQNTPTKGTWKCNQSADGDLDMYYIDRTGALTVELDEDYGIVIYSQGNHPSNAFLMQQTLLLQNLLEELDKTVNVEDVKESDRLLVLKDPNALDKARDTLSFA